MTVVGRLVAQAAEVRIKTVTIYEWAQHDDEIQQFLRLQKVHKELRVQWKTNSPLFEPAVYFTTTVSLCILSICVREQNIEHTAVRKA